MLSDFILQSIQLTKVLPFIKVQTKSNFMIIGEDPLKKSGTLQTLIVYIYIFEKSFRICF